MNISEPFIRRPIATSLLAVGVLLAGLLAYNFLPVASLPQIDIPTIQVQAQLSGIDPETAATSLAAPLERRFSNIAGVTEMTSTSQLGSSNIVLQFDLNRDIEGAARDVQAAINAASSELPINLPNPPTYRKVNPSDSPVIILALTSDAYRLSELYNYADELLSPRISQVPGVSQIDIGGGAKSAVRVQVNPAALASMGLSMGQVASLLNSVNRDTPKGNINGDNLSFSLNTNDQLKSADDYKGLVVAQKNGVPITLSSIATVFDSNENRMQAGWYNSKRSVLLFVRKQADANVIDTVDRVKELLPQMRLWLPPAVHLEIQADRTTTIRASVSDVRLSLMVSVALVVLVCFLFLRRFWPTFIASIIVPLSLAGTFGVMYLLKFSLDNISLMALTVCVGFVVDDAIVVIENIVRHLEEGLTPVEAALKGAKQIGFTVISISISLVAVFIPLLFMGGLVGRLFHEFSVTLSASILVSAVVSLTLTPMMCARFLKQDPPEKEHGWFYTASEKCFDFVLGVYSRSLRWVLKHSFLMLFVTFAVIGVTVWLYGIIPKGFFPQQDTGMIMGQTEAAQDISFTTMVEKQSLVTAVIMKDPAVDSVGSSVGSGGGGSGNNGRMFITLKPKNQRKDDAFAIVARLRQKTARIPGIGVFLIPNQDIRTGGRSAKGQFLYSLVSEDFNELNVWVPKLMAKLQTLPQLKDLTTDQQFRGLQSNVIVDREIASRFGISPQQVDTALYSAFGQRQVSVIYTNRAQFHVVLEATPQFLEGPQSLDKIYVPGNGGKQVPLSAFAHFETTNTATSVPHQGQFPAITISFNTDPGVSLQDCTQLIAKAAHDLQLPPTIRGSFQGTAQVFQASLSSEPILIVTAIIAVYIVLGVLYESFIHPITILSTLPSAGLGALLALLMWNLDLSVVSLIGIILLIGIVKKNAIMMVDFALEAERHEDLTAAEAIYKACIIRFRPIMMTTMAALFGAVPLATGHGDGAEIRQPLGVAIIGGLVVSQLLTLYTTPIIYIYLDRLRSKKGSKVVEGAPMPA
jgi:multidrug efflux pump